MNEIRVRLDSFYSYCLYSSNLRVTSSDEYNGTNKYKYYYGEFKFGSNFIEVDDILQVPVENCGRQ